MAVPIQSWSDQTVLSSVKDFWHDTEQRGRISWGTMSPARRRGKTKTRLSAGKISTIVWDLWHTTRLFSPWMVNVAITSNYLMKWNGSMKKTRPIRSAILFHGNALSHTVALNQEKLDKIRCKILEHPHYAVCLPHVWDTRRTTGRSSLWRWRRRRNVRVQLVTDATRFILWWRNFKKSDSVGKMCE